MPLVSSVLQLGIAGSLQPKIKEILENTTVGDKAITADQKALELSNAIAEVIAVQVDAYIKTATVIIPPGSAITTTPGGPGTIILPMTGTIT